MREIRSNSIEDLPAKNVKSRQTPARTEGLCQAGRYQGEERVLQVKGIGRPKVLLQDVLSVFSEEASMAVEEYKRRVV